MIPILERLKSTAVDAQRQADQAKEKASASVEAANQAAAKAESLQRSVESAKEVLATADQQREFYYNRAQELLDSAAGMWGQSRLYMGASITSSPVYATLGQCERAVIDFDERVRPLLVARIEAAEADLDAFAATTIS
jgi:ElaB/YqjD/DUF883 family membrane-anchored ribosome-binding protein